MVNLNNTYCIHREQDNERLTDLKIELDKIGLEPVFIEPLSVDDSIIGAFTKEMDSLRRTTISIIDNAIKDDLSYIAIMEDDCVFDKQIMDKFLESDLPDDFDFIHLNVTGGFSAFGFKQKGMFNELMNGECCQFYIVNRRIFERYKYVLENNKIPIDRATFHLHQRTTSWAVIPHPVVHKPNRDSTLRNKIVKY